jgi:YfiH family protein
VKERKRDDIPFFQFESYPENRFINHAMFTRQGGISPTPFDSLNLSVSVPDDKARVYDNRRRAYGIYGRDTDSVVHAHLVHGANVGRVSQANNGTWVSRVDGIITNEPGCALTMNYADCTPIFLYDPANQAIGLGHAGWQGAVKDLPGAIVRAMEKEFGSDPGRLIAGLGPCIGPCCYEVGESVIDAVHDAFGVSEDLLLVRENNNHQLAAGHRYFDLPEANWRNLRRAGVDHIEQSALCTACHTDLFYSHRAEKGRTGRFGAVLILLERSG